MSGDEGEGIIEKATNLNEVVTEETSGPEVNVEGPESSRETDEAGGMGQISFQQVTIEIDEYTSAAPSKRASAVLENDGDNEMLEVEESWLEPQNQPNEEMADVTETVASPYSLPTSPDINKYGEANPDSASFEALSPSSAQSNQMSPQVRHSYQSERSNPAEPRRDSEGMIDYPSPATVSGIYQGNTPVQPRMWLPAWFNTKDISNVPSADERISLYTQRREMIIKEPDPLDIWIVKNKQDIQKQTVVLHITNPVRTKPIKTSGILLGSGSRIPSSTSQIASNVKSKIKASKLFGSSSKDKRNIS